MNSNSISLHMSTALYTELFDCEIEPYDTETDIILGSQGQFISSMLHAEHVSDTSVYLQMSDDAFVYLVNIVLPQNMEMWFAWGSVEGDILMEEAKHFLDEFNVPYPY